MSALLDSAGPGVTPGPWLADAARAAAVRRPAGVALQRAQALAAA